MKNLILNINKEQKAPKPKLSRKNFPLEDNDTKIISSVSNNKLVDKYWYRKSTNSMKQTAQLSILTSFTNLHQQILYHHPFSDRTTANSPVLHILQNIKQSNNSQINKRKQALTPETTIIYVTSNHIHIIGSEISTKGKKEKIRYSQTQISP
jgi:hypothetical protein